MTVGELIYNYQQNNPDGHFFDADTLRFFGERRSEMNVLKDTTTITDWSGKEHECYVLSSRQRRFPGGPRRAYYYFDTSTFDEIQRGQI